MSLLSRINRLEAELGTDDAPRHIMIDAGPRYEENWIEWGHGWDGNSVHFHVRIPDHDANAMDYLTPEQRAEIRPGDSVVVLHTCDNGRNPHLEMNKPPWKRSESARRYCMGTGDQAELNGGDQAGSECTTVLHFEDNGMGGDLAGDQVGGCYDSEHKILHTIVRSYAK